MVGLQTLRVDLRLWMYCRQTAPYSPELEPDIVLTQPHASGVDEICIPFGDRRRWQHNFALGGSIALHWVAELIAFSRNKPVCHSLVFVVAGGFRNMVPR